jgi:hypothetical protein
VLTCSPFNLEELADMSSAFGRNFGCVITFHLRFGG